MSLPSYEIEITDVAEMEARAAQAWYASHHSPERAEAWYHGLLKAFDSLSTLPRRRPLAPENAAFEGVEIRQLEYGSGRSIYRILFTIIDDEKVRILHVLHGAQQRLGQTKQNEDDGQA